MEKNKNQSQLILYQTEDGKTKLEVRLQDETVWLSQQLMTELFQTTKQNISLHIKNIFDEGELSEDSVVKDFLTTLQLNEREILTHAVKISHQIAIEIAMKEYEKYSKKRQIAYDKKGYAFDASVNETKQIEG